MRDYSPYSPESVRPWVRPALDKTIGDVAPPVGEDQVQDTISPIDFVTPGMVASPFKLAAREYSPYILNEIKSAVSFGKNLLADETGAIGKSITTNPALGRTYPEMRGSPYRPTRSKFFNTYDPEYAKALENNADLLDGTPSQKEKFRHQDWKLHVSTDPEKADETANIVLPTLQKNNIDHKVVPRELIPEFYNRTAQGATSSQQGKFITAYPKEKDLLRIGKKLAKDTSEFPPAPIVHGEYPVGGNVYARFSPTKHDYYLTPDNFYQLDTRGGSPLWAGNPFEGIPYGSEYSVDIQNKSLPIIGAISAGYGIMSGKK